MRIRSLLLFATTTLLVSCEKAEKALVDLSSTIFIIFLMILGGYQLTPWLVKQQWFEEIKVRFLLPFIRIAWIGLLVIGFGTALYSLISEEIRDRILIFVGFIISYLGVQIHRFSLSQEKDQQLKHVRLIILSFSFVTALLIVWLVGDSFLKL